MSATAGQLAVTVPDIGDFGEVPVIELLVSVGDTVAVEDPLVTLESDKATMDVPAPAAGVVRALHVKVGDSVSEGSPILDLETSPEDAAQSRPEEDAPAPIPDEAQVQPGQAPTAQAPVTAAAVPETPPVASPATAAAAAEVSPAPSLEKAEGVGGVEGRAGDRSDASNGAVYASPSVRRLARELGVDLHGVAGSGRNGRLIPEDVRSAASGEGGTGAGGAPVGVPTNGSLAGLGLAPWPVVDFEKFGPVERVERTRIQKISAPNLARNWVMIPHVTHNDDADITGLEAWRKQLNAEQGKDGVKFTMVTFLVAASVATLKEFPIFNSSLDGEQLVLRKYLNVGFAADTPNGLVVPVIKDADRKGLVEIARELTEISGKARAGKLGPADMSGGTFTISSLGGIGGTSFTPIINAPEVAILGATRSQIKPVWEEGSTSFVPRLMLPLSLSYDHRVIDGAAAARFVAHLVKVLSDLRRALL